MTLMPSESLTIVRRDNVVVCFPNSQAGGSGHECTLGFTKSAILSGLEIWYQLMLRLIGPRLRPPHLVIGRADELMKI